MRGRLLLSVLLAAFAAMTLGARCYSVEWNSANEAAAYGSAVWHEVLLAEGEYRFSPPYAVRERQLATCDEAALVRRGLLLCHAYVLDVDTPRGTMTISGAGTLLELFGPIESEAEAASLIRATVGGLATYDNAAATVGDVFLVRVDDLRHNCTPAAAFYKIIYEVRSDGTTRIAGEEPARREHNGGAVCYD